MQYDYELSAGTIMARFDGSYQSHVFNESFNTQWSRIDSYFLGNARISFTTADDDWNIALEVQNLFDKFYWLTKSDITTSLGLVTGVPGLPAHLGVECEAQASDPGFGGKGQGADLPDPRHSSS